MAVELADLDLRADLGILGRHAAERDVVLQQRRARAAGDHADLAAPDVDAVAVRRGLVAFELETDERPARVLVAPGLYHAELPLAPGGPGQILRLISAALGGKADLVHADPSLPEMTLFGH